METQYNIDKFIIEVEHNFINKNKNGNKDFLCNYIKFVIGEIAISEKEQKNKETKPIHRYTYIKFF